LAQLSDLHFYVILDIYEYPHHHVHRGTSTAAGRSYERWCDWLITLTYIRNPLKLHFILKRVWFVCCHC